MQRIAAYVFIMSFIFSVSSIAKTKDPFAKKQLTTTIQKDQQRENQRVADNKVDVSAMAVDVVGLWRRELNIPQTSNQGIEILPYSNP
jgi:hypothetical protein